MGTRLQDAKLALAGVFLMGLPYALLLGLPYLVPTNDPDSVATGAALHSEAKHECDHVLYGHPL